MPEVIGFAMALERTDGVVTAPLGEDLAMMDVDSGAYYVLDGVARFVWDRLARPVRVGALIEELRALYDVSQEQCEADVLPFLERLHDQGLVRIVD